MTDRTIEQTRHVMGCFFESMREAGHKPQHIREVLSEFGFSASEPTLGGPVAWAMFAPNGNIRMWSTDSEAVRKVADAEGWPLTPLYTGGVKGCDKCKS